MSASSYVVESTTEYNFPASKRKKILNHKGEVLFDSAKDKNNIPLKVGSRIVFLYSSDNDANAELKVGDMGTITDLSLLPKGNKHMISVDWDNGRSIALIENKDQYEILSD
jgi:hypothetical protein